jgi:hypothetical protein
MLCEFVTWIASEKGTKLLTTRYACISATVTFSESSIAKRKAMRAFSALLFGLKRNKLPIGDPAQSYFVAHMVLA